jgi:hypothetical protein
MLDVGCWMFRQSCLLALLFTVPLRAEVSFTSPGLPPTRMDDQGRLVEDWGTVAVNVAGADLASSASAKVQHIKLDDLIPATQADTSCGSISMTVTAFRAPVWPSGLDVLTVRLAETAGQETPVQLSLALPEQGRLGLKTVSLGGRTVLGLPAGTKMSQSMRDWGWADDAVSLPGWARPAVDCASAFRNSPLKPTSHARVTPSPDPSSPQSLAKKVGRAASARPYSLERSEASSLQSFPGQTRGGRPEVALRLRPTGSPYSLG